MRELALRVEQREIFLVGLHRQDEALLRHIEEFFLELTHQHMGAFDQGGDLIEQRGIVDGLHAATDALSRCLQLARDVRAALLETGDDGALLAQDLGIVVGVVENHGRDLGLEAVALRAATGTQAQHLDRHHVRTVQGDQAVRRAHKVHAAPTGQLAIGFELVAHHLRDGQFGNGLVECLLQSSRQGGALHHAVVEQHLGLAVALTLQGRHGHGGIADFNPQGLQLLEQGRCGLATGIETDAHRHEFLLHRAVAGLRVHIGDVRRQTAWGGKRQHARGGGDKALGLELLKQHGGEGVAEFFQGLRRQLFDKEFDKQVLSGHGVLSHAAFFWIWATHSRGAIGKPRRSRLSW